MQIGSTDKSGVKEPRNLPQKIQILRQSLGETQSAFGERFNTKKSSVSHWENGTVIPHQSVISQLAALCQLTVKDFLKGDVDTFMNGKPLLPYDLMMGLIPDEQHQERYELFKQVVETKGLDYICESLAPNAVWTMIDDVLSRNGKILVTGQAGTGKTWMQNILLMKTPNKKVLSFNDSDDITKEGLGLDLQSMDAKEPSNELVATALRKNPDVFSFDEIRSIEQAGSLYTLMQLSNPSLVTGIHASDAAHGFNRVVTLTSHSVDYDVDKMTEMVDRLYTDYDLVIHMERVTSDSHSRATRLISKIIQPTSQHTFNTVFEQSIDSETNKRKVTFYPREEDSRYYWV